MLGKARHRRVIEMNEPLRIGHQPHQCLVEIGAAVDLRRNGALQIERTTLAGADCRPSGKRIAQETAATDLTRNETAPLSLLIGAGNRPYSDAKLPCKLPMCGKLVTRREAAGFQICGNGLRDCLLT